MSLHQPAPRLFCDFRISEEGWRPCNKEFETDRYVAAGSKLRQEAAKAGWTRVRSPIGRTFDKDYCPDHTEGEQS